jgi:hypothetical protein
MWTPEPVILPLPDALQMTRGVLTAAFMQEHRFQLITAAAAGVDLVVVQRAEVPVCLIMRFTPRTCWL